MNIFNLHENNPAPLEFDHLFIFTSIEAPAVDQLVSFGLIEGTSKVHPDQGTANRRLFFDNAMVEFLWVHDEAEARSPLIAPTRLWERSRYRKTGYSPFGLAFRRKAQEKATPIELPFETWPFRPPYLPDRLQIDVARNDAHPTEPMLFVIPFGGRPDAAPPDRRQPLEHPLGFREITGLHFTLPPAPKSAALRAIERLGLASFGEGDEHCVAVSFDHGRQGQQIDFRPLLPLVLCW